MNRNWKNSLLASRRVGLAVMLATGLAACVTVTEGDNVPEPASNEEIARASVELGLAHLRNGDRISAKRPLLHALEKDPRSREVHHALAILYQGDLEYLLAEEHYRRALSLDPKFTQARNNFGAFLHQQGRAAEAVQQLELAAADTFYVNRAHVFENLGRAYLDVFRPAEASRAFLRAVNLNPRLPRSHLELAHQFYHAGDREKAYQHFMQFNALSRPTARSLWLGIRLQRDLENRDAVASYALQLRNLFPASEEYRLYRESLQQ